MKWANELTQILNTEYPIVQAPMFGVTTPEMVAAATNTNCLGSLALADLSAEKCVEEIRKTKQLTTKAFAVNIFVHQLPEVTDALKENYEKAKEIIESLAKQNGMEVRLTKFEDLNIKSYQEQVDVIISEGCKIVSFTFGNLDTKSIEKLKENGTVLIGTCTSVDEALILEKSGIDILCVQGWEAGGHRGSFSADNIPKIGGLSLLAQVSEKVALPLIYAGRICNPQTLLATKTIGASGFQVGSLLLASKESASKDFEKERLSKVKESEIVLTKSFSGRYARGIENTFINTIDNTDFILPYPYQNKLTSELRKVAKTNKNEDFVNIWVGQSIHKFSRNSTTDILKQLIDETEDYYRKQEID